MQYPIITITQSTWQTWSIKNHCDFSGIHSTICT